MEDLLLIIPLSFGMLGCLALLSIQRVTIRRLSERMRHYERQADTLDQHFKALLDCVKGVGEKVRRQQKELQDFRKKRAELLSVVSQKQAEPVMLPRQQELDGWERAGRLRGISRGEAELLDHLAMLERQAGTGGPQAS
jgi:hypothetical protein